MTQKKKKILILTGDAGFGHRSAAEAVQSALQSEYGDKCEVKIENPLNHPKIPSLIRESQTDYDQLVKKLPELYKFGWEISDATLPVTLMEGAFIIVLYEVLQKSLKDFKPDLVITTYPIYQAPLDAISQLTGQTIPFITVVTDLVTVHHVWFNSKTRYCTIPTDHVAELAKNAGLSEAQVVKTGIPVNPQILALKARDKAELREELGWHQQNTAVLVVGSPRIPDLNTTLETLNYSGYALQLALVAGGNDDLLEMFHKMDWRHPTKIYDFVDFMPRLMRAADLIVCKAGGLIVTESLASGLPLMLAHFLPGQEKGNVDFVVDNNAGALCQYAKDVLHTLADWLRDDRKQLGIMANNAAQLVPPDAAMKIAKLAHDVLDSPVEKQVHRNTGPLQELLARFNIPPS